MITSISAAKLFTGRDWMREVVIAFEDGKIIRDLCSEDVSFCKNIQKANYQIYIDTTCRVGHSKSIVI